MWAGAPAEDECLRKMTQAMLDYDRMMELAKRIDDYTAIRQVQQCRDSFLKRHSRLDSGIKAKLDEDPAVRVREREKLRAQLRERDREAAKVAQEKKALVAEKKAKAAKKKSEKEIAEALKLEMDKNWSEQSFGQGLPDGAGSAPDFKKCAKGVLANYREALERLRLRCPQLPEHLAVQWSDFVEDFGNAWLHAHRAKFGNLGGRAFLQSVDELFKDCGSFWRCCLCSPSPTGKNNA